MQQHPVLLAETAVPLAVRGAGFLDYLEARGLLDGIGRKRALQALLKTDEPMEVVLLELGLIEEINLLQSLAGYLGIERAVIPDAPVTIPAEALASRDFLRQSNLLPLDINDSAIVIATAHPLEDDAARALAYALGRKLILRVAPFSDIARHFGGPEFGDGDQLRQTDSDDGDSLIIDADAERLRDLASEAPVVRLLTRLVAAAMDLEASDIHIEPLDDQIRIRFRVDGSLRVMEVLDKSLQLGLISRIKILAKLNIAEQRLPQDGRIRLAIKGRDIDFRVSTSPALHGEGVVLRILDRRHLDLNFQSLGFSTVSSGQLRRLIATPNGIILVTGPTGSGKTTTLYAALSLLNRPESKVFTVEDPIEYHMKGINQILVKPHIGLDFAAVLRSVLRQDPDVIMIGEIRDSETARIAVQASLTGHLVLSTLHTNSAAASITRLRNIGIDDFLIASTLRGVLAQRLVRRLCDHCRRPSALVPLHFDARQESEKRGGRHWEPVGCGQCGGTGYRGRTVIYEIMEASSALKQAVARGAAETEVETIATSEGMKALLQSARLKVDAGETSLEEVARAMGGTGL